MKNAHPPFGWLTYPDASPETVEVALCTAAVITAHASAPMMRRVFGGPLVMRHQRRLSSTSPSPNPTSTVPVARSRALPTDGRRNQRESGRNASVSRENQRMPSVA